MIQPDGVGELVERGVDRRRRPPPLAPFDALAVRGDHSGDQRGDQEQTKQAETFAMPEAENPSKSAETPGPPNEAETPAVNF